MKVLVVEDDHQIQDVMRTALEQEGYEVDTADTGADGEWLASAGIYDLLLLDVMLPEQNGLAITDHLRSAADDTPIILVTARDTVTDRVAGLDVGADDYVVKPFALSELMARIRAVLRRKSPLTQTADVVYDKLRLDPKKRTVTACDQELSLTQKEYELLEFFLLNPERILTRGQIFERIWGFDSDTGNMVVDVYVHYLRKKLASVGCQDYITTLRGVGFMLKES